MLSLKLEQLSRGTQECDSLHGFSVTSRVPIELAAVIKDDCERSARKQVACMAATKTPAATKTGCHQHCSGTKTLAATKTLLMKGFHLFPAVEMLRTRQTETGFYRSVGFRRKDLSRRYFTLDASNLANP